METYAAAVLPVPVAPVVPVAEPLSLTDVLTQLIEVPGWTVTMSEYAVVPVLSLRAMVLYLL